MLLNRQTWPQHRGWVAASLVIVLIFLVLFVIEAYLSHSWPTGSSDVGLIAGMFAGGLILFEMGIWVRKRVRTWRRLGRAKVWMIAHIWLGLIIIPISFIHSGWQWGGPLSTSLMVLLILVVGSGIFGFVVQQFVPNQMFKEVPAETIYSQIDNIVRYYRDDAIGLVQAACGTESLNLESTYSLSQEFDLAESQTYHVLSVTQSLGEIQGKVFHTKSRESFVQHSPELIDFFTEYVDPFLQPGSVASLPLADSAHANNLFEQLRRNVDPKLRPTVKQLQELCDQRRQLVRQAQLHWLLHGWLLVHLPLSVALVALLFAHAFVALRYM